MASTQETKVAVLLRRDRVLSLIGRPVGAARASCPRRPRWDGGVAALSEWRRCRSVGCDVPAQSPPTAGRVPANTDPFLRVVTMTVVSTGTRISG